MLATSWRVTIGGLSVEAAMDSCVAGDTVLVAPGEYPVGPVLVTNGIVFRGEEGPRVTRFVEYPGADGGFSCTSLLSPTVVEDLWFDGFTGHATEGAGAINILDCLDVRITGCLFTGNDVAGIVVDTQEYVTVEHCTFTNNVNAIWLMAARGTLTHCIVWDAAVGLLSNYLFIAYCNDFKILGNVLPGARSTNFSLDPLFCGTDDFRISPDSPCAPGQSPLGQNCGLVGAFPADCTTTPVKSTTWGGLKALYRNR